MNRITPRLTALAGATGLALVAWLNLSPGLTEAHATVAAPVAAMPATRQTLPDFAELVSRVGPAVAPDRGQLLGLGRRARPRREP